MQLYRTILLVGLLGMPLVASRGAGAQAAYEMGAVTVDDLVTRALVDSPELQATQAEVDAAHGRLQQAGLRPNPMLDLGVQKRFSSGPGGFMVRVDLLNVFNWTNYVVDTNPFGGVGVAAGQPANSVGLSELGIETPTGIRGPERTVKLAASYAF